MISNQLNGPPPADWESRLQWNQSLRGAAISVAVLIGFGFVVLVFVSLSTAFGSEPIPIPGLLLAAAISFLCGLPVAIASIGGYLLRWKHAWTLLVATLLLGFVVLVLFLVFVLNFVLS